MSEQFAFDEFGGNRGTIQGDERPIFARAFIVQGARHQFLAGSGFTVNADSRLAASNALDLRHQPPHCLAAEDDFVFAHAPAQLRVFDLRGASA